MKINAVHQPQGGASGATTPQTTGKARTKPHITVLHAFHNYLSPTENWAYNLMQATPNVNRVVAARRLLPQNFFAPNTTYLPLPLYGPLSNPRKSLAIAAYNIAHRQFLKRYPAFLAKARPDIDLVHAHFGPVGYFYRRLRKLLGKPLVVSFYGRDYEHVPHVKPEWHPKYQELFQLADCFVCEGPHGAGTLAHIGCPPDKIVVNPLGVRPEHIPVLRRHKAPERLDLLQIASVTGKKGHVFALEAFIAASTSCPNATLTFVGSARAPADQSILDSLLRRVADAGLADRVKFVPGIDYARLYDFLKDFDVFIHPSVYTEDRDCEGGAPVVLLDAQATGMPVISTTHCDIPSEVIDGETGLLAPERDVGGFAAHIRRFYAMDASEYQGFCKRARKHVEEQYDIARNAVALRDIYQDVIDRAAPSKRRGR